VATLLLDHNLSPQLARLFRRAGHMATTAAEMHLDQADDAEILRFAGATGLILVTADEDFAVLHPTRDPSHAGILLVPESRRGELRPVAEAVLWLLDSGWPLIGELYAWSAESGWRRP